MTAVVLTAVYQPLSVVIAEDEAVTEASEDAAVETVAPTEKPVEKLSSVTIVHTAEISEEDYQPTDWWKADIDEYEDMSLVKYETVGGGASGEPELLAEGRNDTIISNSMTESAVSSTEVGTFAFTSYGWGHCVGLSQNGANFYAKYGGWNYRDILFHYYPGTVLKNTGTAESETVTVQGVPGNVLQQVAEIVNREIGPSFHPECIKAQAVAVYTYMKYHDNDAHDLKGKPDPPQSLVDLCAQVLGEALYYNNDYCLTMFYASCGGITANCNDVFSADIPYLRSVASEYDSQYDPHWGDVVYYSIDEVRNRIQGEYGITLSSNPENWIKLVEGNGGYVNKVIIDDQITVRGYPFSSVMGLKSPKYTYIVNTGNGPEPTPTEAPQEETEASAEGQDNATPPAAEVPVETVPAPAEPDPVPAPQEEDLAPPPMPADDGGMDAPPLVF
ncbi:MAG: sporulation protein [Oscillospiraceae bacterium]|nr:sporulation protein [Oscillospiraceae bacterium]